MSWRLAPTLTILLKEINALFPLRDKTSDGTIGDTAHATTQSDHNPDHRGVVCAVDIDEDLGGTRGAGSHFQGGQAAKAALVDQLVALAKAGKLPQLFYVIYERKIYSRTRGFQPKAYTGRNAHTHHVHVSVFHEASLADRTGPWNLSPREEDDDMPKPEDVWNVDINPAPGPNHAHDAAWYLRDIHTMVKAQAARSREQAKQIDELKLQIAALRT